MSKPTASSKSKTCPNCSAPAVGRFCAECGAALSGATCASCGADLTPGAQFCHRCGAAAESAPRTGAESGVPKKLPWVVASIALVALLALVVGQRLGARGSGDEGTGTASPAMALPPPPPAPAGRAPDISNMTPREMADRLFNRIVRLEEAGKADSARFLATYMAIPAFRMIDTLDADVRYHLGRVALLADSVQLARAQADTILRGKATHLLGLLLASEAARRAGDERGARQFEQRLIAAEGAERRTGAAEYGTHDAEITRALAEARRRASR